jgi:hypothetical protein
VRFAAIAVVVVLGLATVGVTSATTPKRTSLTGKISVLKVKTITVKTGAAHGTRNLTCRITTASPKVVLRGFTLGTTAKITCTKGVLSAIARPPTTKPTTATPITPDNTQSNPKTDPQPDPGASTTPGTGGVKIAPNVTGNGRITLLTGSLIEFGSSISCQLTSASPNVGAYRVGSLVSYTCSGGALTSIGAGEGT